MTSPAPTWRVVARAVLAIALIGGALYGLYWAWSNWNWLTRQAVGQLPREHRGDVRNFLGDYRLLIEILVVFAVASIIERILNIFPRSEG